MTLIPCCIACLRAGDRALGSLAETTMAFTCCAVKLLIQVTWSDALAVDGPTCLNDPFSAVAACFAPLAAVSKYGLLMALGRNTILSVFPPLLGVLPPLLVLLPPQPARTKSTNTQKPEPSVSNSFFTVILLLHLFLNFPWPVACGMQQLEYAGQCLVPGPKVPEVYQ